VKLLRGNRGDAAGAEPGAWPVDRMTVNVGNRAGHGVAVLLKIYAHCIDGQATAANQRIAEALGIQDAEDDPGDEGDGDTEQAS
jgi:hypothetical protein